MMQEPCGEPVKPTRKTRVMAKSDLRVKLSHSIENGWNGKAGDWSNSGKAIDWLVLLMSCFFFGSPISWWKLHLNEWICSRNECSNAKCRCNRMPDVGCTDVDAAAARDQWWNRSKGWVDEYLHYPHFFEGLWREGYFKFLMPNVHLEPKWFWGHKMKYPPKTKTNKYVNSVQQFASALHALVFIMLTDLLMNVRQVNNINS